MHAAVYSDQIEVAKVHIEHGADLSVTNGITTLDQAFAEEAIFYQFGKGFMILYTSF